MRRPRSTARHAIGRATAERCVRETGGAHAVRSLRSSRRALYAHVMDAQHTYTHSPLCTHAPPQPALASARAALRVCCTTRPRRRTPRARRRTTTQAASSSSSPEGAFDYSINAHFFPLGDGDAIRLPSLRPEAGPRYEYSREEVCLRCVRCAALCALARLAPGSSAPATDAPAASLCLISNHSVCAPRSLTDAPSPSLTCPPPGARAVQAIKVQLQALQNNDEPYFDHGIETLYRFADVDPFQRSPYFG